MCGRYNVTDNPAIHALLDDLGIDIGPLPVRFELPRYNISPTDPALTLYCDDGEFRVMDMRWWLVPSWSSGPSQKFAMFNARAETVATSKAFATPFKRQRAVVPASSFIEWRRSETGKQPYLISPDMSAGLTEREGALFFAAIWDCWKGGEAPLYSCSIITTEASVDFSRLHHRQPVMLGFEQIAEWLDPASSAAHLAGLMQPCMPTVLQAVPIDQAINNARIKDCPTDLSVEMPESVDRFEV